MFENIKLRWFVLPFLLTALFSISTPPVNSWGVVATFEVEPLSRIERFRDFTFTQEEIYEWANNPDRPFSIELARERGLSDAEIGEYLGYSIEEMAYQSSPPKYGPHFYDERLRPPADFSSKDKVRVSVILIKVRWGDTKLEKAARKKIDSIHGQIKNGADFGEMARKYSEDNLASKGGDFGSFAGGYGDVGARGIFGSGAFDMEVIGDGEVSAVFKTGLGFHLLKVTGRKSDGILPTPPLTAQPQPPPKAAERGHTGTGFLFSAKDYVITNWHVVRGTNNIKVKFLNGEKIEAEVALKDPQNDIAFLKLEQSPQLPASDLKIGDSSKVKKGDKVFTIGYPAHRLMGDNPKYTEGVVNAISGLKDDPTVFQVSVQIQPGNSGGPLFNSSGEVIGITQSTLNIGAAIEAFGTLPQNVNYAIKSSYISVLLPMLPETLVVSKGFVVIPSEPKNGLADFIEKAEKNIVLIEAK